MRGLTTAAFRADCCTPSEPDYWWVIDNQDALRRALPDGIEYVGNSSPSTAPTTPVEAGAISSTSTATARSTGSQPRHVGPAESWVGCSARAAGSLT